ncbi:unnamed protein product [Linum tenue]|uniref:Uncharacterized protein n=1 Tax=Linum tenue TaxID=586396 RepID=A0AAV0LQ21_9ROSI|nr:unnamed protein product [Linum tenue]
MVLLFDFKSDKHFVASSDKTTLKVYELSNPTIYPSYIRKAHWKEVGNIIPRDHDDSDEGGLMFFDGQAQIVGREALAKLAQHLARLRLMVSPQGHCFQDVTELGEHRDFGIHYLRLNDLFNWPLHGIGMASVTTWPRCVLKYAIPSRVKQQTPTTSSTSGGVSKEKYEELKRTARKNEEKLREEMEEQDEELQKLKEEMEGASEQHEAELRELEKKKDEELRRLAKKRKDELETLRKDKADDDERRKQLWAVTATTRFFSSDAVLRSRRRPVPPDTWSINYRRTPYISHRDSTIIYEPYAIGASTWFPRMFVQMVDEEPGDWAPPPRIHLLCMGYAFDKHNWWFVKTTHPDCGVTMIAYYDGNRTWFDGLGHPTPLPVALTYRFDTDTPFFFVHLADRYKLAFMYRGTSWERC